MSQHYTPYPIRSSLDYPEHYAVRIGGVGGKLVGRDFNLDRYQADLLCDLLEQARDAGREGRIAA